MRKLFLTVVAGLFLALQVLAQDRTITGKVTDERERGPIGGVSVLVSGTSVGTTTAADGSFSIKVPNNTKNLVFSSVNYVSQVVNIAGVNLVNVRLTSQEGAMNEVVVVG
jgi:hypothetical protein